MKRSKFSAEQIAYALRLAESGTPVVDAYLRLTVGQDFQGGFAKIPELDGLPGGG